MAPPIVHRYQDWFFFGRSYWRLHGEIDGPVRYLGRRHRMLYHDYPSAVEIARRLYPGDLNAEASAILHIQTDEICTFNPEYKKRLIADAKRYFKGRRKRRRRRRR